MSESRRLKFELLLFAALVVAGFVALPFCIYFVGQQVIGEYAPDAGALDLLTAVWRGVLQRSPSALLLVMSPWLVISCLRLATRMWRRRKPISPADPA